MKIVAHSDHAAVAIRHEMIEQARAMGHEVDDLGPAEGESVDFASHEFRAEKVHARRIGRVRITPVPPGGGGGAGSVDG